MSSSSMLALLPMMEAMYLKKRATKGASYKMVTTDTKGIHVIASKEITPGELILVEESLHIQPSSYHPSLLSTPEYQSLIDVLSFHDRRISRDTTTTTTTTNPGRLVSNPDCRIAYDRLSELNARAYITNSNGPVTTSQLEEIWKLEDSHRQACVGDTVMIDGLASKAGKKLNGKCGLVTQNDSTDPNRLGVQIGSASNGNGNNNSNNTTTKSIKRSNLKTLGGIMRTNSYQGQQDTTANLFKELSRINHACGDAANVDKMILGTKVYLTAKRNIHVGEGIWIDYLPGQNEIDRHEILHGMFNFWCDCSDCQNSGRIKKKKTTTTMALSG